MAVGVNIVSTFNSKGIDKAIKDFQKLNTTGEKAAYGMRTFDKAATNGLKNLAKYGGIAAAGLGAVALNFVKGAEFAKQADDRLGAINKSMGLFGAQTDQVTERLIKFGDTGEYKYGILAETIKDTQSKLLTFANIAKEADITGGLFDRATVAALDLQAAGFGEASQNAVQLGKALQDPIKGITALARSGVTFTAQEKEKIKALVQSGKMYEAQETLLKAIEMQVGGTAASTATATFKIGAAFGHVRDELGTLLLPLFEKFANFMINTVVPYATKFGQVVGEQGIGAGLRMLAGSLMGAISGMGTFGNTALFLVGVFVTLRSAVIAYNATLVVLNTLNMLAKAGFLGTTVGVWALNAAMIANPIGLVVAGIVALIAIITILVLKFQGLRDAISGAWNWLKGIFTGHKDAGDAANYQATQVNKLRNAYVVLGGSSASTNEKNYKFFRDSETGASKLRLELLKGKNTMGGFADATGGAGKAVESAKEKLQKYIDALKGMSSAQRSVRDADKSLMKSRMSLTEATTELAEAQEYFNQVFNGYGANSKQAKDRQVALRKAQGAVEKAGYDVENAIFAVADAEKELADLRKDPESSAQAIREAEISLAEAKLGVKDATESQVEATDSLAEAERLLDEAINGAKEGSDAYTEALQKLNDAKRAQVDASDAVTDALERQADALERLAEAEEKALAARVGGTAAAAAEAKYGITYSTGKSIGAGVAELAAVARGALTQDQADALAMRRLTPFATGGIVTGPTRALIGEAGPEAVIPLDKLQSGVTVNVTVNAGMGTDAAQVGDEIVNILQRYNRRNGALPLKVA